MSSNVWTLVIHSKQIYKNVLFIYFSFIYLSVREVGWYAEKYNNNWLFITNLNQYFITKIIDIDYRKLYNLIIDCGTIHTLWIKKIKNIHIYLFIISK